MEAALEELKELIAHKLHFVEHRPGVVSIAGFRPIQLSTMPYPEVFGVKNLALAAGQLPKDADLVLFHLQGRGMAEILANLSEMIALPGLTETLAGLNNRVILLDDRVFTTADKVQQLEILAEVFYPKFFAFGHEGTAWAKLNL